MPKKPLPNISSLQSLTIDPSITMPSTRYEKYNGIQLLRFIAALTVIIFHATMYTSERLDAKTFIYEQGGAGVTLFFVISGFVMIIASQNIYDNINPWKIFGLKRIIRIVPIYWIMTTYKLLTLIFASSLIVHHEQPGAAFIIKSYLFLPSLNPYHFFFPLYSVGWTLNYEVFFYALFTISLAARINPLIFLSTIFIPFVVLSYFKTDDWPDFRFYFDPIILNFLSGMIVAKLVMTNRRMPKAITLFAFVTGLAYLFLPKFGLIGDLLINEPTLIQISAFIVVYAAASAEGSWTRKIPGSLIYLGGASYSLYLIHPCIAPFAPMVMSKLNIHWPIISCILAVVISVCAGTLFFKIFEDPITRYLSRVLLPSHVQVNIGKVAENSQAG